jgi:hypothetical protein
VGTHTVSRRELGRERRVRGGGATYQMGSMVAFIHMMMMKAAAKCPTWCFAAVSLVSLRCESSSIAWNEQRAGVLTKMFHMFSTGASGAPNNSTLMVPVRCTETN